MTATLIGADGDRLIWAVSAQSARYGTRNTYEVSTRRLPSGALECVRTDGRGRARRLKPGAQRCACAEGQWGDCIHLAAARAHEERDRDTLSPSGGSAGSMCRHGQTWISVDGPDLRLSTSSGE